MPLRMRNRNLLLTERPFQGVLGAKLYVGTDGPESILFRPARAFNPQHPPLVTDTTRDVSVATTTTPPLEYTLPDDLVGEDVWYQVRTYAADYENDTLYRPRQLSTDEDGDGDDRVYGTATVVGLEKRDEGGLRITFAWRPARDGVQPETFTVVKTSGTGTIADVEVSVAGAGEYTADVVGLTNEVAYTFRIDAENGAVVTTLVSGIAFTGDDEGPPVVTNVVVTEA